MKMENEEHSIQKMMDHCDNYTKKSDEKCLKNPQRWWGKTLSAFLGSLHSAGAKEAALPGLLRAG